MTKTVKIIGGLIFVLAILNLGYLDYLAIFTTRPVSEPPIAQKMDKPTETFPLTKIIDEEGQETLVLDYAAISSAITEATSALTLRVTKLEQPYPSAGLTTTTVPTLTTTSTVKEYYIPLGSSKLAASNWTDVPGVEAYIAPSNFGGIKEMYFEVSLKVPSGVGTAYARLRNVTDNVSLFESEVLREGGNPGLVSSGRVPVPANTKLYRAQVKSSLGAEVELVSARIKLFVQ